MERVENEFHEEIQDSAGWFETGYPSTYWNNNNNNNNNKQNQKCRHIQVPIPERIRSIFQM
jgi:hypothetical protein